MPSTGHARWFDLTPEERRALIIIITLFLIGLTTWTRLRLRERADRIEMLDVERLPLTSDPQDASFVHQDQGHGHQ